MPRVSALVLAEGNRDKLLIIDNNIVIAHMKKCGGTSVCKGLIETLAADRIDFWGYTPEGEQRSAQSRRRKGVWKHSSIPDILRKTELQRENLTIYLISLRPWWDRVASFYFHAKRYNRKTGTKYPWVQDMSFSAFLRSPYVAEIEQLNEFSASPEGAPLADVYVPYSELSQWYGEFATRLGHPGTALPEYNRGRAKFADGYRETYTEADFALMAERFAQEDRMLERLGLSHPTTTA
jgi:hypothetical protein